MHPDIQQEKPGLCPKCGMTLVLRDTLTSSYPRGHLKETIKKSTTWESYTPLIVIFGLILLTTVVISVKDSRLGIFSLSKSISYFMIGFFVTFAGFKLMDLPGFARGYFTYDLFAKKWFSYGYIYPFIELFFGITMILLPQAKMLLFSEFLLMVISGLGVAIKLVKKERFECSCLGTFLKVPLTKVTLVENFGMAGLALLLLILP